MIESIRNHFTVRYAKDTRQICHDLFFHTPIKYFSAMRIFKKDFTYLGYVSDGEWAEHFLMNDFYSAGAENEIIESNLNMFSTWSVFSLSSQLQGVLSDFVQFGYGGGASVSFDCGESVKIFYFATNLRDNLSDDFFIKNQDLLRKFIMYFSDKVNSDKQLKNIDKIKYPVPLFMDNNRLSTDLNFKSYMESTLVSTKKFFLGNPFGGKDFTKKEIECLVRVFLGKSAKVIGRELHISHRTVEKHVENIKFKTQMDKEQLFEALTLSDNFLSLVKCYIKSKS